MTFRPEIRAVSNFFTWEVGEHCNNSCCIVVPVSSCSEFVSEFIDSGIAEQLVVSGCKFFVLTGSESAQGHDLLDEVLERLGAEEVLTTHHEDDESVEDIAALIDTMSRAKTINEVVVVLDGSRRHKILITELEELVATNE